MGSSELHQIEKIISEDFSGLRDAWPDPLDLSVLTPQVEELRPEMLPVAFAPWMFDISERMNVPLDFPAAAAVVALSIAVGRRVQIFPKKEDESWRPVPNLWGAVIGRPGTQKTPALAEGMSALTELENKAIEIHQARKLIHERELERWKIKKEAWKEGSKRKARQGGDFSDFDIEMPREPICQRFITNDATAEKLHELLRDNPGGILYSRDELSGFFAMLDRENRSTDRAFLLEAWEGHRGFSIDRIQRGSVFAKVCCVSVFGGIQPSKLRAYLADAANGGLSDDGLLQRLQILVWPEISAKWQLVDRPPDQKARDNFKVIFERISNLDPEKPTFVHFSDEAQLLFFEWWSELEVRLRGDNLPDGFVAHLSKYRSLVPSLALIFSLADWALVGGKIQNVELKYARLAAAWAAYLESHARKVYQLLSRGKLGTAELLAEKIRKKSLADNFTARDVYIHDWSGLTKPEDVIQACEVLADHFWLREDESNIDSRRGRPSRRFHINPKLNFTGEFHASEPDRSMAKI